jgi:hypothetical protein
MNQFKIVPDIFELPSIYIAYAGEMAVSQTRTTSGDARSTLCSLQPSRKLLREFSALLYLPA